MKSKFILLLAFAWTSMACTTENSPSDDDSGGGGSAVEPKSYMDLYDPVSDAGQFNFPDRLENFPEKWYDATGLKSVGTRNNPSIGQAEPTEIDLRYHLLTQSLAGIADLALSEGKVTTGVWMDAHDDNQSFKDFLSSRNINFDWTVKTGDLLKTGGNPADDSDLINKLGKKYVLTDVEGNPESGNVAIVASHVYGAVIVDVLQEQYFKDAGFEMVYNATDKTVEDSFNEFKSYCKNDALVVMPVHTGELADFAIANRLFVINLNKQYNTSQGGQNVELFKRVLAWLKPNSPVLGWEPGVGEDEFVRPVSASGNMMVATANFNIPYLSQDYKNRQSQVLAKVINPNDIDYDKPGRFVSFYLSDGAHCGWMMEGFEPLYLTDPMREEVNMSFGITGTNLCQLDPDQFAHIINIQPETATYIESFGHGYWYSDNFGEAKSRQTCLSKLASMTGAFMRQHRIKILEQISYDPKSAASIETYQAMVDANDQLEGIVVIQYAPSYAFCEGDIMWVTNKAGYDIPVVTVSYAIWNWNGSDKTRDGCPTHIARKLNEDDSKFSAVIVHAWSSFHDTGDVDDPAAESAPNGPLRGASAAELCARRLNDDIHVVNMQELIWRIRMEYRPEQTKKFLEQYY